jgi:hypothetical protein
MKEEEISHEELKIPLIRKATPFVTLTNRERDRESNFNIYTYI